MDITFVLGMKTNKILLSITLGCSLNTLRSPGPAARALQAGDRS